MPLSHFLPGRPAIVALALIVGPAVAGAAEVDERALVFASLDTEIVTAYLPHPDVEAQFADDPSGIYQREFLGRIGGASIRLQKVGTPDDRILMQALLGRAYVMRHDFPVARQKLESALAAATAEGWSEARLSGILLDLAWVANATGDQAAAAGYRARAATCPLPCGADAITAIAGEAKTASEAVNAAFGPAAGYFRVADAADAAAVTFAEETFGETSEEVIDALRSRAVANGDDRPWKAIEYYQRLIDLRVASGVEPSEVITGREAVAVLMLKAGEYARLVPFAASLATDALAASRAEPDKYFLRSVALEAPRLRARALWHLRDPGARAAYGEAIETMFSFGNADTARLLVQDLIDARYDAEADRVAKALVEAFPGDEEALLARARVAARDGRYDDAATLVAAIAEPKPVAVLQRAAYLDSAGKAAEASALRTSVKLDVEGELSWGGLSDLTDPRDFGAYEGAAAVAKTYLPLAEQMIASATYVDAQRIWQIAYTLALGGDTRDAFRLMRQAASIAARLSFADANATDGGSLQLLRRDKFRYLLFVDIAWAAITGAPPDSMSVSSRY